MKPYEQTVRVLTTFFAALAGFGLKNILDQKVLDPRDFKPEMVDAYTLPLFIIAGALALRFIVGSTNLLYLDYVMTTGASVKRLLWEALSLVYFGTLCALLSFTKHFPGFWFFAFLISFSAIVWFGLNLLYSLGLKEKAADPWFWTWPAINAVQSAVFGFLWLGFDDSWWRAEVRSFPIWAVAGINLVFLAVDLFSQFVGLEKMAKPQGPAPAISTTK